MNSTGEHLHPNWRALATLHISLKRFVPAGVNPTNDETLSLARHELSSDFNGEKVKEFYENIIQDEQNTSNCSPPQMASKLEKPRVKIVKIPFEAAKLFRAAMSNDVQTIENMQFDNDDINAKDAYGWTALMMAACDNSKAAVELLLHLGANRQIKDKSGNTAEALANLKGHTDVVGLLRNYTTEIHEEKIDQEKAVLNERHVESFDCETCKETFTNTSEKAHYTSTLHRFCHKSALPTNTLHKFNIAPRNRGLKLMKKQGWDCASGLGPSQSGRLYPIKTVIRKDRTGLGVNQNAARVAHFHAFDLRATKSHKNHNKPRTRNDIKREKLRDWKIDRRLRRELS